MSRRRAQAAEPRKHPSKPRASNPWASLWPFLALIGLGIATYVHTLDYGFYFDDTLNIVANRSIRDITDLPAIWHGLDNGNTVQGRPLLNLTLALNHAAHGDWRPGYRAVNIALHIANAMLLFALVFETLKHGRRCESLRQHARLIAFFVAAVWLVHPLNTESVTYVIQRAESLAGFFFLATMTSFAYWLNTKRWYWLAVACGSALCGMASKEIVFVAPFVLLMYDRTFYASSWRDVASRWWAHALMWSTTGLLIFIMATESGTRGGSVGYGLGISPWEYFLTSIDAVATYLKLAIFPRPLVFDYGTDVVTSPSQIIPQIIVVFGIAIGGLVAGWRWPWIGFLTLAFAATLAPTSSFIPVATQTRAEHRMYLPLAAVVTFLVAAVAIGAQRWKREPLAGWAGVVVILALAMTTWYRNLDYRDATTVWTDVISKRPQNQRAVYNLACARSNVGKTLLADGSHSAAMRAFEESLTISPGKADLHDNYAAALASLGRLEEALQQVDFALEIEPNNEPYRCRRGRLRTQVEKLDQAIADFSEAIRINPDSTDAFEGRAVARFVAEDFAGCLADLERFRELGGDPPQEMIDEVKAQLDSEARE